MRWKERNEEVKIKRKNKEIDDYEGGKGKE